MTAPRPEERQPCHPARQGCHPDQGRCHPERQCCHPERQRGIFCEDRVAGLASGTVGRAIPTATQNTQAGASRPQRRRTQKTAARDAGGAPSLSQGGRPRDALAARGRSPFSSRHRREGACPHSVVQFSASFCVARSQRACEFCVALDLETLLRPQVSDRATAATGRHRHRCRLLSCGSDGRRIAPNQMPSH
jgi:hypothetical protein